ncbi:MAG: segregation/condensation protein A [Myxococcota bacterium]|nr:segregation/condensation protein A [Myxococcota bacterium]
MQQLSREAQYLVKLDVFEGPLDLLLHLIRKHELNIFDIPIAFITSKYLEYLDLMKQLNLDLASEYLDMASTLVLIKSRMLLPAESSPEDELVEDGPDPREALIRQLLEYQKYKSAAMELAKRPMLGRDSFPRGASESISVDRDLVTPGLFALLEAFQSVIAKASPESAHEISVTRISVSDRINQLIDQLRRTSRITFVEFFKDQVTRGDMVVTFLSILEMVRLGLIRIHQTELHTDIHILAAASLTEAEAILETQITEEQ